MTCFHILIVVSEHFMDMDILLTVLYHLFCTSGNCNTMNYL